MGYWRQFEYFDPLKGQFPNWPFPQGQSIVYRARSILHGRTSEQILEIARDADGIIEQYFMTSAALFSSLLLTMRC